MNQQPARSHGRIDPAFHDVATNGRRLAVLYSVEVELTRLVGGWVARTPELSEKLALGKMAFDHAEHARLLGERLLELRIADPELAEFRRRTSKALKLLEAQDDPVAFLAGLSRVVKPALIADLQRHLDSAPPYVDDPSVRILRPMLATEQEHIATGLALLAGGRVDWAEHAELEGALGALLWDLEAPDGGLSEGDFVGRDPVLPARPHWPVGVEQLTYHQPAPPYPEDFDGAMRRCIHDLVFSETEALDIFGQYVYAFAGSELPWQFHREAARICWDEARHVELLLDVLDRYGGRVGEFPAKAPGYEEYVNQDSLLEKIIMVNVIAEGEVSTDTQTQHRDAFRELGDELSALLKDYEMADEVVHGRFGLRWARWLVEHTGADYSEAYANARKALDEFKSQHDDEDGDSPIPLVRLGVDETGSRRVTNLTAKQLVGFTDEDIERIRSEAGSSVQE